MTNHYFGYPYFGYPYFDSAAQTHTTQAYIATRTEKSHTTSAWIKKIITKSHTACAYSATRTNKTHDVEAWIASRKLKTHTTRAVIESVSVITKNNYTKIDADTDANGYVIRDTKAEFVGFVVLDKGTSWSVTFYDASNTSDFDTAHEICVYNTSAGAKVFKFQKECRNGLGYKASGTVAGNIVVISEKMI